MEYAGKGMTIQEAPQWIEWWFNKTTRDAASMRLGQWLYYISNLTDPWPELFYEKDPGRALAIWYQNMDKWLDLDKRD